MTLVRADIAHAIREAAKYNADFSMPPAAVFWPDPDRVWESVIGLLQEALPILVLGDYDLSQARGPAIWIRAVLSGSEQIELPPQLAEHDDRNPWVVYLPGHSRSSLSEVTSLDPEVAPLIDVALRSNWWPSAHGQSAWTPHSFLGSKHGAGLDVAGDAKSKAALASVLDRLLAEDIDELLRLGRLDATRLHALVLTDSVRTLMEWLNDPEDTRQGLAGARWEAFVDACRSVYGFDPSKDGQLTAAARLGARDGGWSDAWNRFADNPRRYPNIPGVLDQARPQGDLFGGNDPHPDSWPSWNAEQEDLLRQALADLGGQVDVDHVRPALQDLAAQHSRREDCVWGQLGLAPLAHATGYLAELAVLTKAAAPSGDLAVQVAWYSDEGFRADDLALRAIAAAATAADRDAVSRALHAIYDPWVDETAREFQGEALKKYVGETGLAVSAGTCVVFVDALRFDLGQRLARRLGSLEVVVSPRLAAFPTVTPTGQPAVAPVRGGFGAGPSFDAGDSSGRSVKGQVFRAALSDEGVQYLQWTAAETGDVNGIAWTQTNTIDALGHDHGHALAAMLDQQLELVVERIRGLLGAGWRKVVVVTDHGFLMLASAAMKVTLPLAVTEGDSSRKPRVARLKAGASRPDFPILPWTWDPTVEMVSAPGATAFEAGTIYEHGGLSLQECVIPVIEVSAGGGSSEPARITGLRWTGQRCRIDFDPVEADVVGEVRLAPADAATTIGGPRSASEPGEIKILVDEEKAAEGTSVFVVLLGADGVVLAQRQTTVGGGA